MKCNDIFVKRRSNRFLSNEKLREEDVEAILEAGELAPVARGLYNTMLINVYEGEKLEHLKEAYFKALNRDVFFNCSLFIVVSQKDERVELANQNAGAIIENMLLEAAFRDIGSVFVYSNVKVALGFSDLLKELNIKEGYTPIAGALFGKKVSNQVRDIDHKIEIIR